MLGNPARTLYGAPVVTGVTAFGTCAAHQDSVFFLRDVHEGSGIYTVARLAMTAKAMRGRSDEGRSLDYIGYKVLKRVS